MQKNSTQRETWNHPFIAHYLYIWDLGIQSHPVLFFSNLDKKKEKLKIIFIVHC